MNAIQIINAAIRELARNDLSLPFPHYLTSSDEGDVDFAKQLLAQVAEGSGKLYLFIGLNANKVKTSFIGVN